MTTASNISWAHAIRRNIYGMIILLLVFSLILLGYYYWSQSSSDKIRHYSNNYHLISSSNYLKATQQLLHLQSILNFESVKKNIDIGQQEKITSVLQEADYGTISHLIQKHIKAGLGLQHSYDDRRFESLSAKLARQLSIYETSSRDYINKDIAPIQLRADVKELLITLSQLIRLHSISRDVQLAKLQLEEKNHTLIFYALLAVLFIAGTLIARRSMTTIADVVNKQQQAEDIIKHQAYFDNLTKLPNRLLALDRLSQLMHKAQRDKDKVAVLFLDLDDFKKVNDTLGHDVGDKLLVEAAKRLNCAVRSCDTVGRLGGDEFIVILGGIDDVADIQVIAEDLIDQIKKVFNIDGREMVLSASIGISIYPDDASDESTLLRNADAAMYHSKDLGRSTYSYFTDEMNLSVSRRLVLEEQMHGALERGEFTVFYQLQVDLDQNKIIGAEALLRWQNQALGSVFPDEFIPIAEQTGMIVPIGLFVLSEAVNMAVRWQSEYCPEFRMAINVSPRQLRDPLLVSQINKVLQKYGFSTQYIELEITEGVLMSGNKDIDQNLTELSNLGVSIAMDDFGTGYSSLSNLRSYPFNVLKIDRSFIMDVDVDSQDRELINAAIAMAHALNLKVVAEGVETEEQLAYLKEVNCDYAQGYLFGKPMPAEDISALLKSSVPNQARTMGL